MPVRARPSERLSDVRAQAVRELVREHGLDPKQSADLVLRLPGTTADLPEASPVGAYVPRDLRADAGPRARGPAAGLTAVTVPGADPERQHLERDLEAADFEAAPAPSTGGSSAWTGPG